MAFTISKEQYQLIELSHSRIQLRVIFLEYANEIEQHDPELAKKIREMEEEKSLKLFTDIYNLTSDRYYQIALLALLASTEVNIFEEKEFSYIMNHPFLSGDAKARHIILSSLSTTNT